jgi:polar amino acid transport system substrate-binding protein
VDSLDDLVGKRIIIKEDGITHNFLKYKKLDADITLVHTRGEALRKLVLEDYDYALFANVSNRDLDRKLIYLEKLYGRKMAVQAGEILPVLKFGFATIQENAELISRFSSGFNSLRDRRLDVEIYSKWLGADSSDERVNTSIEIGRLILSTLLLLICSVVFWNRSLQKEVDKRTNELALKQQQLIQADKLASLGTLVSGVAHEINNPTGLILYNLAVLERVYQAAESTLEEKYQEEGDFTIGGMRYSMLRKESGEVFNEIKVGASRIKQIVDDLKGFAKKGDDDYSEKVDLNQVLYASMRLIESTLKKASCKVNINCEDNIPAFMGSSQRIEQVIINIIINACQARVDESDSITAKTYYSQKDEEVVIEVQDEGVGIPADQLDYLTDPFYTTKRNEGGTGLGLSISANIISDHRGKLKFSSKVGEGTTVSVHLPVYKGD